MRIVCDTNCLVSGLIWTRPPARIFDRIAARLDLLFISRGLLHELVRVPGYARIKKILRSRGLKAGELLRWVVTNSTLVTPKPLAEVAVVDDPSDDIVLACARSVSTDAIVSGDSHLLSLSEWAGIPVIAPRQYLTLFTERS